MRTIEGLVLHVADRVMVIYIMGIETNHLLIWHHKEDAKKYYTLLEKKVQLKVDSRWQIKEIKEVQEQRKLVPTP